MLNKVNMVHVEQLMKAKLWNGSMLQLKEKYGNLRYIELQNYCDSLKKFQNDPVAPPTKDEKELAKICGKILNEING